MATCRQLYAERIIQSLYYYSDSTKGVKRRKAIQVVDFQHNIRNIIILFIHSLQYTTPVCVCAHRLPPPLRHHVVGIQTHKNVCYNGVK